MKNKILLLLLTVMPFAANAQKVKFKENSYGIFNSQVVSRIEAKVPAGYSNIVNQVKFVQKTKHIPANIGSEFGIEWEIISEEVNKVNIEIVWIFPKPMSNGQGESFDRISQKTSLCTNQYCFSGYMLEKDFEIIEGRWTCQIFYNGKKVLERKFNVINMDDEQPECSPIPVYADKSFIF